MSLPIPKLDDRTFDDLVREAQVRILSQCPDWTDFNASDPGMTLVDVMAWMTETILYRLNRIPERNYIKFMELMGIRLRSAEPARAWVVFMVTEGADLSTSGVVDAGTVVSTIRKGSDDAVPFETTRTLNLTAAKLVRVESQAGELHTDHTSGLEVLERRETALTKRRAIEGAPTIFEGAVEMPHALYLVDSRLDFGDARLGSALQLRVMADVAAPLLGPVNVEWECWDGTRWSAAEITEDGTQGLRRSGAVLFATPPRENAVDGLRQANLLTDDAAKALKSKNERRYALRARLVSALAWWERKPCDDEASREIAESGEVITLPTLTAVRRNLEVAPHRELVPDKLVHETPPPTDVPQRSLPGRNFQPFGKEPREGDTFYVRSAAFARPGAVITLTTRRSPLSTPADVPPFEIVWEYCTGESSWTTLPIQEPEQGGGAKELLYGGRVRFAVPRNVRPCTVAGDIGPYIRARITSGIVGLEAGPKPGPQLESLVVSFADPPDDWESYTAQNYMSHADVTPQLARHDPTRPFEIKDDAAQPALYLGFDRPLPNTVQRLYVSLARRSNVHNVQLRWEYSSATGWDQLEVSDGTKAFSENGVLEFIGPALWATAETLGHPHYWLRCRSMLDDVHPNAVLKGVFPNAVEVVQARSFRGEALGSSTARPLQSFQLIWTPVLPGSEVLVREKTSYDTRELDNLRARLGHDAVVDDGRGGFWILWREVESFYHSGPNDRHYTLDPIDGVVTFGDGKRGMIPPRGDDNVKANVYQQTAGARGNVAARTIAVLESAAPGVDKVANPEPAGGGADAESIEDAKLRAPSEFKARYRAVTTEDFECLAQQASGQVAKAHATRADGDGADEVVVVIVPREAPGDPNTSLGKLRPDGRLIRQVRDYLDVHRLITSRLRVRGPDYQDIRLSLTVHPTPEYMERFSELKILIAQRLRAFIHPLRGPNRGSDGDGWPMGRTLHKSELYYVVEAIPGVDYVDNLLMWKWAEDLSYDANMRRVGTEAEDNIYIEPWAFHYFRELEISRV